LADHGYKCEDYTQKNHDSRESLHQGSISHTFKALDQEKQQEEEAKLDEEGSKYMCIEFLRLLINLIV
jgi:hypothetical protein